MGGRSQQQGITVRRCAHHCLGADDAPCAAAVVDDDLLADDFRHFRDEDAPDDVGVAAGGEWDHHAYRLCRVILRQGRAVRGDQCDCCGNTQSVQFHYLLLGVAACLEGRRRLVDLAAVYQVLP
jgi:hypothetical protein